MIKVLLFVVLLFPLQATAAPYLIYDGRGGVAIYNPDPVGYHCWVRFRRGGGREAILYPGGQTVWYSMRSLLNWGCSRG